MAKFDLRVPMIATALLAAGCAEGGFDTAGLTGSASMRIDVEVYKGPLSKQLEVQKNELLAKVEESGKTLNTLRRQTTMAMCSLQCFEDRPGKAVSFITNDKRQDCDWFLNKVEIENSAESKDRVCHMLNNINSDLMILQTRAKADNLFRWELVLSDVNPSTQSKNPSPNSGQCVLVDKFLWLCPNEKYLFPDLDTSDTNKWKKYASITSKYAEFLRARSAFWATQQTSFTPESKRARIAIANYAQFLAEYGNQIGARVDAIVKQDALVTRLKTGTDPYGNALPRELLATSTFLRDAAPTGYLNLYQHNKAAASDDADEAVDRIRLVEQLTADTYWTRVNTVFASGQGDVTMAFVKDDIGNWDLKKFDNRPGQLLDAYKSAGLAALGEVANLATGGGAQGVSNANRLLQFANRLNYGGNAPDDSQAQAQVTRLRERAIDDLNALRDREQARHGSLNGRLGTAREKAGASGNTLNSKRAATELADKAVNDKQVEIRDAVREEGELKREIGDLVNRRNAATGEEREALAAQVTGKQDERSQKIADISRLNGELVQLQTALTSAKGEETTAEQTADKDKAAVAVLESQLTAVSRDAAKLARSILDAHLRTLEEIARSFETAEAGQN